MSSNVNGFTVTGGTVMYTTTVNIGGAQVIDITPYEISIYPGDVTSIVAYVSEGTPTVGVSVVWNEDI
jgi:hypothetical protein